MSNLNPDAIQAICQHATRGNFGKTVWGVSQLPDGILVTLSSWPRQKEAAHALRVCGYRIDEDSRATSILVQGYDHDMLTTRSSMLGTEVQIVAEHLLDLARAAIDHCAEVYEEPGAEEAAREHARTTIGHLPDLTTPSFIDLGRLSGDERIDELLAQIHGREAALRTLLGKQQEASEVAVGFLYERHQHHADIREAAGTAMRAVREWVVQELRENTERDAAQRKEGAR